MASRRTYILLGAAAGSYFVGFILCIVGYSIPWMQPKATYNSAVLSVGLVTSCFKNFKFPQYIDRDQTLFDGCSRVYEPRFDRLQDYVNPVWFARVRQMHFACILILSLNILLIIGYVAMYILAVRQTRKRGRPTSPIVLTKAACSLWFVFVGVVAILQIVEPSVFHYNYDKNSATFYTVPQGGAPLYYSGGFAVTIVAAFFCIASTVLGGLLFVGVCRKASRVLGENYIEKKMGGSIGGAGDLSAASLAYNRREGERRAEADGADLIEKLTAHSQQQSPAFVDAVSRAASGDYRSGEPPRASYTPSRYAAATADDQRGGGGDRASLVSSLTGSQQQRPVPAPRRSLSSRSQDGLHRPPSEEPEQPAWPPSRRGGEAAAAARSSAHELRHGSDHSATKSGRERAAIEVASEYGDGGGGSSRRRYSAGSSYRPQQPAAASAAVARPPSISSGGGGASGPRQQPEDSRSGGSARRPGDLSLGQGSLPRSSTSGGGGGGGESHPTSLTSTDISVAASVHYESNPASGYKPKELAMLRFISDRSQAANAAAAARASMERSRSSGGGSSSRGSERGQQPRQSTGASGPTSPVVLKSPVGPKSPSSAAAEGGPQPPALSSTPSTKKNSIYVSY